MTLPDTPLGRFYAVHKRPATLAEKIALAETLDDLDGLHIGALLLAGMGVGPDWSDDCQAAYALRAAELGKQEAVR